MNKKIYNKLVKAIDNSSVITFFYKGFEYEFEPYLIWRNDTTTYVHGFKRAKGGIRSTNPHICNLILDYIENVVETDKFVAPLQGYNANAPTFVEVLHAWRYAKR